MLSDVFAQVPEVSRRFGVLGIAEDDLTAVGAHTQVAYKDRQEVKNGRGLNVGGVN